MRSFTGSVCYGVRLQNWRRKATEIRQTFAVFTLKISGPKTLGRYLWTDSLIMALSEISRKNSLSSASHRGKCTSLHADREFRLRTLPIDGDGSASIQGNHSALACKRRHSSWTWIVPRRGAACVTVISPARCCYCYRRPDVKLSDGPLGGATQRCLPGPGVDMQNSCTRRRCTRLAAVNHCAPNDRTWISISGANGGRTRATVIYLPNGPNGCCNRINRARLKNCPLTPPSRIGIVTVITRSLLGTKGYQVRERFHLHGPSSVHRNQLDRVVD